MFAWLVIVLPKESPKAEIPVWPQATPTTLRLSAISDNLIEALGLTARQGRLTKSGAQGVYNQQTGVIRMHDAPVESFGVLSHEGGHALNFNPANKAEIDALIDANAGELIRFAHPDTAANAQKSEGLCGMVPPVGITS